MGALTRSWPALFGWGSGLMYLSLGAAILLGEPAGGAVAVAAGLLVFGVTALVWGALCLHTGHPVAPRVAGSGAVVGVLLSGGALIVGCSPLAVAASIALALGTAATIASQRRTRTDRPRPQLGIVGVAAGAILVAALATPALSSGYVPGEVAPLQGGNTGPHAGH